MTVPPSPPGPRGKRRLSSSSGDGGGGRRQRPRFLDIPLANSVNRANVPPTPTVPHFPFRLPPDSPPPGAPTDPSTPPPRTPTRPARVVRAPPPTSANNPPGSPGQPTPTHFTFTFPPPSPARPNPGQAGALIEGPRRSLSLEHGEDAKAEVQTNTNPGPERETVEPTPPLPHRAITALATTPPDVVVSSPNGTTRMSANDSPRLEAGASEVTDQMAELGVEDEPKVLARIPRRG